MVIDNIQPFTAIFKGFFKVTVHITGHSLHVLHPVDADPVNKVIYSLFLLAIGKVQHMSALQVHDQRSVFMAFMKKKFINAKILQAFCRLLQFLAFTINGIQLLKALLIDLLDCILA